MASQGTGHHVAGLGQLQEITRASPAHYGKPGHEGYLNERVVALPELLSDGGILYLHSGKWHLGLKPEHHPVQRGFGESFALLPGCANHYAYEPRYEDPSGEPGKFFEAAKRALHVEDDNILGRLPEGLLQQRRVCRQADRLPRRPNRGGEGEAVLCIPSGQCPAPREVCDKYRGLYDERAGVAETEASD